jgi:hypothetical protein
MAKITFRKFIIVTPKGSSRPRDDAGTAKSLLTRMNFDLDERRSMFFPVLWMRNLAAGASPLIARTYASRLGSLPSS